MGSKRTWWQSLLPWLFFTAGWLLETLVDESLRLADGNIHTGGLGRELWFALHIGLAGVAILIALWALRDLAPWRRAVLISLQVVLGFPLYVFACLSYGIGSGIDFL